MMETRLLKPLSCTGNELAEFEHLVRLGFRGSDESLRRRIRAARRLAFCRTDDGNLVAIAALKRPGSSYRDSVFQRAGVCDDPSGFDLELGWVFVIPDHRRKRIGLGLCRRLLSDEDSCGIFATTRSGNAPMIAMLEMLGYERAGRPFPRRDETLVLFLRDGRPGMGAERTAAAWS